MEELGEVLIGTYEDFIVGYRILQIQREKSSRENGMRKQKSSNLHHSYEFDQSFAVRCHSGSVKCVATNSKGTLAVTSGNDEMINLLSLKKRKLLHTIEVAANCATFALDSHIIFGSNDGNIYIYAYRNSTIELAKILGGHKGPITALSVHPSGKILLSLSSDKTMRTWNLIKGRPAYTTNFKSLAHSVKWSYSGDRFVILDSNDIFCFDLSGKLKEKFSTDKRVNSVDFINDRTLLIASESGFIEFIDLDKNVSLMRHKAHETRIKSVKIIVSDDDTDGVGDNGAGSGGGDVIKSDKSIKFITSSSDGMIKLWSYKANSDQDQGIGHLDELASTDTGARITCMTLAKTSN